MNKPTTRLTTVDYLRHELLDRLSLVEHMFSDYVADHPALHPSNDAFTPRQRKQLTKKLDKIADQLVDAYQFVGRIHL